MLAEHPLAWLVAALAVFFREELFRGRVFSPADLLYQFQPWASARPAGWTHPLNYLRSDEVLIGLPRRLATARDLAAHGLTFWQQHTLVGTEVTFSLHYLGALAWPPMWAFLALPPGLANTVFHLPIPLAAGLSMWFLLRRLTPSRPAQALGTLAWALSGYLTVWLSAFSLPLVVGILPALLRLGLEVADRPRRLSSAAYALLLAWSFTPSYPPANVLEAAVLAVFFAVYLGATRGRRAGRPALRLALLTAAGTAVAGLVLLPEFHEFGGQAAAGFRYILGPLPGWAASTFLFPNLYGSPLGLDWKPPTARYDLNYSEIMGYFGVTLAPPALWGLVSSLLPAGRRRLPWAAAAAAVGLAGGLLAYGVGPAGQLANLPVLDAVRPGRWLALVDLAAALLAAGGLESALEEGRRSALGLAASAAVVLALAAAAFQVLTAHQPPAAQADSGFRLALAAAVLAAALLAAAARPAALLLVLLLAVDLVSFGWRYNPALPPAEFYPRTPALDYLAAHSAGYRVLVATPDGELWGGDVLNVYGIDSVTGYDHVRHPGLVAALGSNLTQWDRDEWRVWGFLEAGSAVRYSDPVWNRLAVRYVYIPGSPADVTSPAAAGWRPVYAGPGGEIYENPRALGQVFLAGAGERALAHTPSSPDGDSLRVQGPDLVVWSRPAAAGWRATLDGRPVSIDTYAGYFLAVRVPPGSHRLAISYTPPDYAQGASISLLGLLALAGLMFWPRRLHSAAAGASRSR